MLVQAESLYYSKIRVSVQFNNFNNQNTMQQNFQRDFILFFPNRKWIAGIGIDLITANFNRTSSMQFESVNEDNLLGNLTNEFHVFTESGSLTPLQMCALFQFFRQMPMYKNSCFHQQFEHFYASKSSKIIANAINNADQSIITSHDQQVM